MEIFKIVNLVTQKTFIASTPYSMDHEWLYFTTSENSPIYEDIQLYGIDNFEFETLITVPYDKTITYSENKKSLKSIEKEEILKFCKSKGSDLLYNRISGNIGNTRSVMHNYQYFYKGVEYKTGLEIYEALNNDGIKLSAGSVLAFLHRNGYLSKENQLKYPQLSEWVKVVKTKRQ